MEAERKALVSTWQDQKRVNQRPLLPFTADLCLSLSLTFSARVYLSLCLLLCLSLYLLLSVCARHCMCLSLCLPLTVSFSASLSPRVRLWASACFLFLCWILSLRTRPSSCSSLPRKGPCRSLHDLVEPCRTFVEPCRTSERPCRTLQNLAEP